MIHPHVSKKCNIHSCRLHKHLEATNPVMNRGFTLRLLSTNWNRLDVASIDFGGAGRASEVLPVYNMAETPAIKVITAAPGTVSRQSSLCRSEPKVVELANTMLDLLVTIPSLCNRTWPFSGSSL